MGHCHNSVLTGRSMKKGVAILLCTIFIAGSLAAYLTTNESTEPSSEENTNATESGTTEGGTTEGGTTEGGTTEDEASEPEPEPEAPPGAITCPDGTNGTLLWGMVTCAEPVVFKASDVSNETVNITMEWYNIAAEEWGNFGPVEIYIVGEDLEAAQALEDLYCERHKALDENWDEQWDCANENYQIFTHYVEEGGAAIGTFKRTNLDYDFMMMTMSAKYPGPEEDDYKPVTLHEYFHIFQHSHISDECTSDNRDTCERDAKMGGKDTPWFSEGGAEFMAQSLYAAQDGIGENQLRDTMRWKLEMSHDGYNGQDVPLDELTYSSQVNVYDVGCWFIAYLIHNEGTEAFIDGFYGDLDELGFDAAFEMHFNSTKDDYLAEFEVFFAQPADDVMAIFPEASSGTEEQTE